MLARQESTKIFHIETKDELRIKGLENEALYNILKKYFNANYKVLDGDTNWTLITKEKAKSKISNEKILDFELHRFSATEET